MYTDKDRILYPFRVQTALLTETWENEDYLSAIDSVLLEKTKECPNQWITISSSLSVLKDSSDCDGLCPLIVEKSHWISCRSRCKEFSSPHSTEVLTFDVPENSRVNRSLFEEGSADSLEDLVSVTDSAVCGVPSGSSPARRNQTEFGESHTEGKVLAGMYVPRSQHGKKLCYRVWWEDGSCTWVPLRNLDTLDPVFVESLQKNPGVKRDFDGGRSSRLSAADGTSVGEIKHQEFGVQCALNAVANGIHIPSGIYEELSPFKLSLTQVADRLRVHGYHFGKRKGDDHLEWLLQQSTGIFAVRSDGHCVTWDADKQVILDTDPCFPSPLPINTFTLATLDIQKVDKVYRILPMSFGIKKLKKG